MTFFATEIDVCPAFGWEGGPSIDVLIRTLRNKRERRNLRADLFQHSYTLPFQNVKDDVYLEEIKAAYLAMGGPLHTFLAKDFGDYRHGFAGNNYAPMAFGIGDGTTQVFQLSKTYTFGAASYVRPITKPVASGLLIYRDGSIEGGVVVSTLTGEATFAAPPGVGEVLAWLGEYRVPVRFSDFMLPSTIDNRIRQGRKFATNGSCSLLEEFSE